MHPQAQAFWDLAYNPKRSEVEKREVADALWAEGGHDVGFYATAIAYTVVARATGLLAQPFQPQDPSAELLAVIDASDPDRALRAGKATWDLLSNAAISQNMGVMDPLLAEERVQVFEEYGSAAAFWMAFWVSKTLFTVASRQGDDFGDFVKDLESFVAGLPDPPS